MRVRLFQILAVVFALGAVSRSWSLNISILDFKIKPGAAKKVNKEDAEFLSGRVRSVAASMDTGWTVMSRENIEQILKDNDRDYGECVASAEGACEVGVGRILNSDYHVAGDISFVGGRYLALSVRLYDVHSGKLKAQEDLRAVGVDKLVDSVDELAHRLFSVSGRIASFPSPSPTVPVTAVEDAQVSVPPAAGATKLVVNFASVPVGASVSADGNFLCTTPNSKALTQGEHWISMGKDGYGQKKEKVTVSQNGQKVVFTLSPTCTRLSLDAVDDRTGGDLVADVYVDSEKVGQTPYSGLMAVNAQIIEVAAEGCGRKAVSVVLEEGKAASATVHFRSVEKGKPKVGAGMVVVAAGCFQMGSDHGEANEKPVHQVCLDSFTMDKYDVTQGAYRQATGSNPSEFGSCGDSCPVENVSWNEAKNYCESQDKRLPTDAEWEYAARAGATTDWYWGSNEDDAVIYAWYNGNSGKTTHPVGKKQPNAWGLYDMAGNVWQWTADRYGKDYYGSSPRRNPTGPASGELRVARGGGWGGGIGRTRLSARDGIDPSIRGNGLGFRCVSP